VILLNHICYVLSSIISSQKCVYFKVNSSKYTILYLYGIFLKFITSSLALFWIFSSSLISPCLYGHHTEFAYSRCGRTIDLYNNMKPDSSMYIKFLLIIKVATELSRRFRCFSATEPSRQFHYFVATEPSISL